MASVVAAFKCSQTLEAACSTSASKVCASYTVSRVSTISSAKSKTLRKTSGCLLLLRFERVLKDPC